MIVKHHFLKGTRQELDEYFKDVLLVTDTTDFRGVNDKFQIPTWPIQQQLDDIEKTQHPKTGFVWYLLRRVINHEDGSFKIEIGFYKEMIWVTTGGQHEPYDIVVINDLIQNDVNSRILEIQ